MGQEKVRKTLVWGCSSYDQLPESPHKPRVLTSWALSLPGPSLPLGLGFLTWEVPPKP